MVDVIRAEAGGFDLLHGKILGQLIDDGADHFKVGELFCANICKKSGHLPVGHGIPLGQIPHGSAQLSVGAAVLRDDELSQLCVGLLDMNGKLQSFFIIPHQQQLLSQGRGAMPHFHSLPHEPAVAMFNGSYWTAYSAAIWLSMRL